MSEDLGHHDMSANDVVVSAVVSYDEHEFVVGVKPFVGVLADGRVADFEAGQFHYSVAPDAAPVFNSASRAVTLFTLWMNTGRPVTFTMSGGTTMWSDGQESLMLPRGFADA